MLGRGVKKPDDMVKKRQEQIDYLNGLIDLQDENEKIQKLYKETGTLPASTQMKDNRTTEDKLRDYELLKASIREDLKLIGSTELANLIIQMTQNDTLNTNNSLLVFLAQKAPDIVKNLEKSYKFGIKGDYNDAQQFVEFVKKLYSDQKGLISSTKDFMARLGSNSSQTVQQKLLLQKTTLLKINSVIVNYKVKLRNLLNPGPYIGYWNTINDIINSITSMCQFFDYIYPKDLNFFTVLDKINTDVNTLFNIPRLQAPNPFDFGDAVAEYLYFINNNIPNLDLLNGFMLNLEREINFLEKNINDPNQQTVIKNIERIIDILRRIFEQIDTENTTSAQLTNMRGIYDNLIKIVNQYGSDYFSTPIEPKKIGEPMAQIPQQEVMEAPEIPKDFGEKQRDYLTQNIGWPPNIPDNVAGRVMYIQNYLRPLINLIPSAIDRAAAQNLINQPQNRTKAQLLQRKEALLNYLKKNKISIKHLKNLHPGPFLERQDVVQEPEFDVLNQRFEAPNVQGFGLKKTIKGTGFPLNSPIKYQTINYDEGVEEDPRYIKFGKYLVNTKKLKDDYLSLRRQKGTPIASLPVYKMSKPMSNIIKKIVGNGMPTKEDFSNLTEEEKKYLHKLNKEADLSSKLEIPAPNKDEEEKDIHLFNVYKGEIMAGNDSKDLIKKFKLLMIKLVKNNSLDKSEVSDILEMLTQAGY